MDFKLQIFRDGAEHLLVNIDTNTVFSHMIMGEHLVRAIITNKEPLDFREGDYIMSGIEKFTLNRYRQPAEKESSFSFTYTLEFEGYVYDLRDAVFMHLGALECSLYLKPVDLIDIIVECMNSQVSSGWMRGFVDDLPEQNIEFYENGKGFSCKGALIKIADQFKLEFWLNGKTINLTKQAGVDTSLVFKYGRGNGLQSISREILNDQEYFNRLYVQGGTKNIPHTYRGGAKRLQLEESYLELPLTAGQKRRSSSVVLDDIFPRRTGTITAASADYLTLTDTSIDFDINGQKIDGDQAVIKFTSGENAGRSFNILSYDHTIKTLVIEPITEADGYIYPNATYEIKTGDKYVFLGIIQPEAYVVSSENDLRTEGLAILQKGGSPTPLYRIPVDAKFLRDNGVTVNAGDRVTVEDDDLQTNDKIRVSGVKYPWVDPYSKELTVSDVVPLHFIDEANIKLDKQQRAVVTTTKVNAEKARRNSKSLIDLKDYVIDPTGHYYTEKIKPQSIETLYLSVGAKETNFALNGVTFTTNYLGNPNDLKISSGQLVHFDIKIDGLGFVWDMTGNIFEDLDPLKNYYVYAKVSRTALIGEWVLSDEVIRIEDVAGYWHLQTGVLFKVVDGRRDNYFTKGMTFIIGDQIISGVLRSLDGLMFFNMTEGKFRLGDDNKGLDWNDTIADTLLLRGAMVQNAGGVTGTIALFRGLYNNLTTYYNGDIVNYDGSLWRYIYATPIFNVTPVEGDHWTMEVSKGATGAAGLSGASLVSRGEYDNAKTYIGSSIRIDVVSFGGLYYFSKPDAGEFSGIVPTNTDYWMPAGGQFESIATGLFFAELAYIENLGVKYLRTNESGHRIEINRENENRVEFFNDDDKRIINLDDDAAISLGFTTSFLQQFDEFGNAKWIDSYLNYRPGIDPVPPINDTTYVYPILDVGITVGLGVLDASGYTSVGRKAVITTGYSKAKYFAESAAVADVLTGMLPNDGLVLVTGDCSLPESPVDGQIQRIKNTTSGTITLSALEIDDAERRIYTLTNEFLYSVGITAGSVVGFQYYHKKRFWVQITN